MLIVSVNDRRVIIEVDPDPAGCGPEFLRVRDLGNGAILAHCIRSSQMALDIAYNMVYNDSTWKERVNAGIPDELEQGLPVALQDCVRWHRDAVD